MESAQVVGEEQTAKAATGGWSLWWRWTGACSFGEFLGIGAAAGIAAAGIALVGEPTTLPAKIETLAAAVASGVAEGLLVGFMQWWILRRRFRLVRAASWLRATALAAATGWFLGTLPSTFLVPPRHSMGAADLPAGLTAALIVAMGLGLGALFGGAQYLVLHRYARRAGSWILANAIGWAIAIAWVFGGASLPSEGAPASTIVWIGLASGLLAGLSVGVITGIFLVRIEPRAPGSEEW